MPDVDAQPGEPTPEQTAAIDTPPDRPLIVLAGPGTGKTFTLIRRVAHLAAEGETPLVLSFTRAVVRELHRRLGEVDVEAARYVRPVTFDSFATRMLSSVPALLGYRGWETFGYEGRIEAAVDAIQEIPEARNWVVASFSHLVVDEVQDLTARRGHLVRTLCDVVSCFSLFGDPAQGIYGWQEGAGDYSADDFLSDVGRSFPGVEIRDLTVNHRAETDECRSFAGMRTHLLTRTDAEGHHSALRLAVSDTENMGSIVEAVQLITLLPGRTAVLCRTNLEALMVSEQLFEAGVDHAVARAATERAAAPWIAQIARGRRGAISRTTFERLYNKASLKDDLSCDDAWDLLVTVSGDGDRIALDRVADALRDGRWPDELNARNTADVLVSTVHRAKGLEFDNVVIVRDEGWREDADLAEEARVLYVALSRARRYVAHIRPLFTFGWRQDRSADRWYRSQPKERWKTLGWEIAGGDAHSIHPAGAFLLMGDVATVQDRLERVTRGDRIRLRRCFVDDGDQPRATFAIEHDGVAIGVTGDAFDRALAQRLRPRPNTANRWPEAINDLRLEGVDTVAGLQGVGADHDLGSAGLWLRVRAAGLGFVQWYPDEETQ